jgi:hypothetical protein
MIATATFRRLSPNVLASLVQDEAAAQQYLDALSLIDDLLSPYLSEPQHARFPLVETFQVHLEHVTRRSRLAPEIVRNISDNTATAKGLRDDAEQMRKSGDTSAQLDIAVDRFAAELADQYETISREY